jgi:hypothetical protein
MFKLISKISGRIAIGAFVLLSATSAYAQSFVLRVQVPFQFQAGEKVLPAGEYRVEMNAAFHRVVLQRNDGDEQAALHVFPADRLAIANNNAALLFHKYGNQHVLRQVCPAGDAQGFQLPRSKAERELARLSGPREVAFIPAK